MSITSTLVDGAEIRFHEAASALRPFVGCFWIVTAQRDATIRIVPDGSTAISIQFQGGETAGWSLRGPLVRPETRRYPSAATAIGVRLRPGVAFLLSGIAAHAMAGRNVRLSDVETFHELAATPLSPLSPHEPMECIDALQRFLIRCLQHANVHPVMVKGILGVVAGLVAFVAVATVAGLIMRLSWPAYAGVAAAMAFTLPMLIARLSIGAAATLAAGLIAAVIARRSTRAALMTGLVLLLAFIPQHILLWTRFPVWYHLTFLVSLLPLTYLGGRMAEVACRHMSKSVELIVRR